MARKKAEYQIQRRDDPGHNWEDVRVNRPITGTGDALRYIKQDRTIKGEFRVIAVTVHQMAVVETTKTVKFTKLDGTIADVQPEAGEEGGER